MTGPGRERTAVGMTGMTGGPRLGNGTGAESVAAEGSTGTTTGADERDSPLHDMT